MFIDNCYQQIRVAQLVAVTAIANTYRSTERTEEDLEIGPGEEPLREVMQSAGWVRLVEKGVAAR